jgi:hypothetical protein
VLNGLTYKTKNRLLLAAGLFFALVVYQLGVSRTLTAVGDYRRLREKMAVADNLPYKTASMENRLSQLSKTAAAGGEGSGQSLLEQVSRYCTSNSLVLRDFPETVSYVQRGMNVETNVFTVEGPFVKLLSLVYLLEQQYRTGRVSSVLFQTREDRKTKRQYLTATLYIQHLKSTGK